MTTANYIDTNSLYQFTSSSSIIDESKFSMMTDEELATFLKQDFTKPAQHAGTDVAGAAIGAGVGLGAGLALAHAGVFGVALAAGVTNIWNPVGWVCLAGCAIGLGVALLCGGGNGLDEAGRAQIIAANQQSQAALKGQVVEAQATCYAAEMQAKSTTNNAILTANSECFAADQNFKAVQEQCKVEMYKADLERQSAKEENENDAMRIEMVEKPTSLANVISAQGSADENRLKGEAELMDSETKRDEAEAEAANDYESHYSYH